MSFEPFSEKTYLIAEAGVNHNGSLETALKLCEMAKNSGANAIKFQTWITENIVMKGAPQALYQENKDMNLINSLIHTSDLTQIIEKK